MSSGGALYARDNSNTLSALASNLSANTASVGGAVYIRNAAGNFVDCQFVGNIAQLSGGSVYFEDISP